MTDKKEDEAQEGLAETFKALEPIKDTKVSPMVGIGALALGMALKYHDISTIHDGALYQQYKLEGRNIETIHLNHVFETAIKMEEHLLKAEKRLADIAADIAMDMIIASVAAADEEEKAAQQPPPPPKRKK